MICVGRFSDYPRSTVLIKDALVCLNNWSLKQIPHRVQMINTGGAIPALKMLISKSEHFRATSKTLKMD